MKSNQQSSVPMEVDEIIVPGWIIPIEPYGTVLTEHALVIHQGKILALSPHSEILQKYRSTHLRELPHHVLMPGFINAHTHTAMTLLRGYADDYALMDWLTNYIWPAENRWVSAEFVADGTLLGIAEMIRGGTTCFNDMYFYPEVSAKIASSHGIRASVGLIVLDFPSAWAGNADEYLDKGLALHDDLSGSPLIRTAFAPHAPYTVSDAPLQRISLLANELNIPVQIHLHETAFEVTDAFQKTGKRPMKRLQDLGLLSPSLQAVHMTTLNAEDIQALVENRVNVIHCPESNLKLASGLCPVDQLLKAGINVALGTDGAASNNDLSMLGEMQTAALLGKMVAQNAEAVNAHTALAMATINGARAMGIDDITGSLVPGKAADVIAIDLDALDTLPVYHPHSHIVYSCKDSHVSHVWVNGQLLLNDGEFCTIDKQELHHKARVWQNRLRV